MLVDTQDASYGRIRTPEDSVTIIKPNEENPLSGPIYVEGAHPGDTLAIRIDDIELASQAWTGFVPDRIYWDTRDLKTPLPTITRICRISNNMVYLPCSNGNSLKIPAQPMIGAIGVAPETEGLSSLAAGRFGGNMDSPEVRPKNTLFLPVFVEGALLHLGDVHAIQGDSEVNGSAVETASECTLTIDLMKGKNIRWPRVISPEYIQVIGAAKPIDRALAIAVKELILWMHEDYGFDICDASMFLTSLGKTQVCGADNLLATISMMFPRKYLEEYGK